MISQPVSSIFPCSPLASGTWRIPGLSIPWSCLPTISSVCLLFFPLSLCLARWFWSDLMNGRHGHTTEFASLYHGQEVFVWSDCLLDLGTNFHVGNVGFVWDKSGYEFATSSVSKIGWREINDRIKRDWRMNLFYFFPLVSLSLPPRGDTNVIHNATNPLALFHAYGNTRCVVSFSCYPDNVVLVGNPL